jgi:hypothetical protein
MGIVSFKYAQCNRSESIKLLLKAAMQKSNKHNYCEIGKAVCSLKVRIVKLELISFTIGITLNWRMKLS